MKTKIKSINLSNVKTSNIRKVKTVSISVLAIMASIVFATQIRQQTVNGQEQSFAKLPEVSFPSSRNSADAADNDDLNSKISALSRNKDPQLVEKFDELIAKAEANGFVRITVGFQFDFTLGGNLAESLRENQRAEIARKQNAILKKIEPFKPENIKQFEAIPYFAVTVDAKTLKFLKTLPEITSISEDIAVAPTLAESVPITGAPTAWNAGYSGSGWAVAVLDSGVDKTHPFLSGKVVSEACYSTTNTVATSVCPGGAAQSTATGSGVNCSTTIEGCAHGTHVAGIAAGRGTSFSGVAKDGSVVAIQIFSRFGNQSDCGSAPAPCALSYTSDQVLGLQQVMALRSSINIASVNMSLGGGQYFSSCDTVNPSETTAIANLRSVGIATIIASGNNGYTNAISSPACISSAVSVGSTGDGSGGYTANVVTSYSNSASFLNLLAPGSLITSSVPGGGYANYNGTSMATPHVAGAWAILKQRVPMASVTDILNALVSTGLSVTDARNGIVKPRIQVDAALQALGGGSCPTTPIVSGQTINGSLANTDCVITGSQRYVDSYTFNGTAGQRVAVSMSSAAFDTYLYLNSSSGTIASDDDGGGGTNSRIPATSGYLTLPSTGTYTILATSFYDNNFGAYSVSLTNETVCNYSISPASRNFAAAGGSGSSSVSTQSGCSWSSASNASWLTISSSGSGGGTASFSVAANSGAARTGTMTIAGQTFTVNQSGASNPGAHKAFDYDGDGKADISIFRPSNGQWWYQRSSNNTVTAAAFGNSADKIAPADFTGDGKTDIALWRPSTGEWFVLRSENGTFYSFPFGANGDAPAPGDYDGDGRADAAVFRASNVTWYIQYAAGGSFITQFGASGDVPQMGDYDADGKTDIAVFRPATGVWWIRRSASLSVVAYSFGVSTDKPVAGDYTGDGKTDAAFFRPSNGNWYVLRSEDGTFYSAPFGTNGDVPAPGDYDGDGKNDFAVFRPSNVSWYINRTTAGTLIQQFGITGDRPTPNAFVP